jgi:hypothetical protein
MQTLIWLQYSNTHLSIGEGILNSTSEACLVNSYEYSQVRAKAKKHSNAHQQTWDWRGRVGGVSELRAGSTCPWSRVRSPSRPVSELKFQMGVNPQFKKSLHFVGRKPEKIVIGSETISIRVTMITTRTVFQQVDHHVEHMMYPQ